MLVALVKPLGVFMANVYEGRRTFLSPLLRPVERFDLPRRGRRRARARSDWKRYALGVLLVNLVGFVVVYVAAALAGRAAAESRRACRGVSPDSSFNTAVSFATQHELAGLRAAKRR